MKRLYYILYLLLVLAVPAQADLYLLGNCPDKEEIVSVYRKLPPAGKNVDVYLRELSPKQMVEFAGDSNTLGMYFPIARYLVLLDWEDLGFVFAHEFGHHVYYEVFTQAQRNEWEALWEKEKANMPRDYARSCASEGWAEAYATTYLGLPVSDWRQSFVDLPPSIKDVVRKLCDQAAGNPPKPTRRRRAIFRPRR